MYDNLVSDSRWDYKSIQKEGVTKDMILKKHWESV